MNTYTLVDPYYQVYYSSCKQEKKNYNRKWATPEKYKFTELVPVWTVLQLWLSEML